MKSNSAQKQFTVNYSDLPKYFSVIQKANFYLQSRNDFIYALIKYKRDNAYKLDGFTTFRTAYDRISLSVPIPISYESLIKYDYTYRKYEKKGFTLQELIPLPIYNLQRLLPFINQLEKNEIRELIELPAFLLRLVLEDLKLKQSMGMNNEEEVE